MHISILETDDFVEKNHVLLNLVRVFTVFLTIGPFFPPNFQSYVEHI